MSTGDTGLTARVRVHRGEFDLDVTLDVRAGEVLAVLGRNGSGKSTLLAALAGLLRPDSAQVTLEGRVLTDSERSVLVPPHRRRIGLLAQQPRLFPHMSVLDNVAFGPRAAGQTREAARATARRHLGEVGATEFARRRPGQLSGGQAQRVALARALATKPELLLLDEPLAPVDVEIAPALRALLRSLLADRLTVIVTHQVIDALVLADRVVVLDSGRVVEHGPTLEVLTRPRSAFAARLAGLNLVAGTAIPGGLRSADGTELTGVVDTAVTPGVAAVALFAPSAVTVHLQPPPSTARNVLAGVVSGLEPQGSLVRVRAQDGIAADLSAVEIAELALRPGNQVWFVVKAADVTVHAVAGRDDDAAAPPMSPEQHPAASGSSSPAG